MYEFTITGSLLLQQHCCCYIYLNKPYIFMVNEKVGWILRKLDMLIDIMYI